MTEQLPDGIYHVEIYPVKQTRQIGGEIFDVFEKHNASPALMLHVLQQLIIIVQQKSGIIKMNVERKPEN